MQLASRAAANNSLPIRVSGVTTKIVRVVAGDKRAQIANGVNNSRRYIHRRPFNPGNVHVSYRKPPASGPGQSTNALREVGKLLDDIVRDALK